MSKKKKRFANYLNDLTYTTLFNIFMNLAINRFIWEGSPVEPRHIEYWLFYHGKALFFQDKDLGYLCLKANHEGGNNVYNEPVNYRAVGHGYSKIYTPDESVLIRNNRIMTNTFDIVHMYVLKLYQIERSLDVNVQDQKFPYIIRCNKNTELTVKNIFTKIEENEPKIFIDRDFDLAGIEVLQLAPPLVTDKLSDYRHDVMNELLSVLGINNANTDKRERLITEEVIANDEYIKENLQLMLESRQDACKKINEMFGLNMTVHLRDWGENYGNLYPNNKKPNKE